MPFLDDSGVEHLAADIRALADTTYVSLSNVDDALDTTSSNPVENQVIATEMNLKAPLASPTFTGAPAAPTASAGTNTTQLATTAFVQTAIKESVCQYRGTATSATAGTDVTQVTLNTQVIRTDSSNYSLSSNGVKVATAGTYRVSGSVYLNPDSSTTNLGVYIKIGSSFSGGTEVNACLIGKGSANTQRAVQCIPKLVSITANQIVFLGCRCMGAAGTVNASHASTFLQIEKVPS